MKPAKSAVNSGGQSNVQKSLLHTQVEEILKALNASLPISNWNKEKKVGFHCNLAIFSEVEKSPRN